MGYTITFNTISLPGISHYKPTHDTCFNDYLVNSISLKNWPQWNWSGEGIRNKHGCAHTCRKGNVKLRKHSAVLWSTGLYCAEQCWPMKTRASLWSTGLYFETKVCTLKLMAVLWSTVMYFEEQSCTMKHSAVLHRHAQILKPMRN